MHPSHKLLLRLLATTTILSLPCAHAYALPTGGSVAQGSATIAQSGNTLSVTQASSNAVINWSGFNLASDEKIQFSQPSSSSITLNRINSASASVIDGTINANGNVWLLNSQGVLFGKNAQVSVGGLLASTSRISDGDFIAGNYRFTPGANPNAQVSNAGTITITNAGLAAFVAPNVSNSGTIDARLGKVQLASGDSFAVDLYGDGLINLQASPAVTSQLLSNTGTLSANGGTVTLTAAAASGIVDSLINLDGVVQAQTADGKTGEITVFAEGSNAVAGNNAADKGQRAGASEVLVSGTLDASGYANGQKGGTVQVLADNVGILAGASIDASGNAGGGTVRIGGDTHGQGATPAALHTIVQAASSIKANAVSTGNGGNVTVWADDWTNYAGSIEARGGALSGNGGFVETSGKQTLSMNGTVDASAAHGTAGTWLLDPNDITIENGPTANAGSAPNFADTGSGAIVNTADIESALDGGTSVSVTASGNITVSGAIAESTYNGTESLTLAAGQDITFSFGADITASGNSHLNVILDADTAGAGGAITLTFNEITSNGGNIIMGGGANPAVDPAVGDSSNIAGVYFNQGGVSGGGGNIIINGKGYDAGNTYYCDGITFNNGTVENSGAGSITLNGTGGATSAGVAYGINQSSGTIETTGSGGITMNGYGGGSSGDTFGSNAGVFIGGLVRVTGTGNIVINGTGGISSPTQNGDIYDNGVEVDGQVESTGTGGGSITITGHGGDAGSIGDENYGVFSGGGTVTSVDGAIRITGTSGASASLDDDNAGVGTYNATITGTGNASVAITGYDAGTSTTNPSEAVVIGYYSNDLISTKNENITINGYGSTNNSSGETGVLLLYGAGGAIETTGTGSISITGSGGGAAGNTGIDNGIVILFGSPVYTTGGGSITLTGIKGVGTGGGVGITSDASGNIIGTNGSNIETGAITLIADNMSLGGGTSIETTGALTLHPYTSGTAMNIGSNTGGLDLNDTYLGYMNLGTASSVTFGDSILTGAMNINTGVAFSTPVSFVTGSGYDITLGGNISSSGTQNASVILASGGNFLNSGSNTITTGGGGSWQIYSATPSGDTFGGLNSSHTAVWDNTYGDTVSQTGDRYIFSYQPTITFTSASDSKTYGTGYASTVATDYTVSSVQAGVTGVFLGDTNGAVFSGAPGVTSTGSAATASVDGGPYTIFVAQGTLASLDNYALAYASSGSLTVNAKTLTASLTGVDKTYDAGTSATLASGDYSLSGIVNGDTVTLSDTTGSYDTKNVGTGKTVSFSGLTLGGSGSSNYALASTSVTGAVGEIDAKSLTANLTGTVDKIYDGSTTATLVSGNYNLSGVVSGDTVTLSDPASGSYDTKNVGTGKTVSVSGLTLGGGSAGNYTLASTSITGAVGEIDAKSLTANLTGTVDKIYDGSTTATLVSGNYNLSGVVSGDTVTLSDPASGSYDTKNVGTGKTVSVSGLTLGSSGSGNYTLASTSVTGAVGEIDAAPLSIHANDLTGSAFATIAPLTYSYSGLVGGDNASVITGMLYTAAGNNSAAGTYAITRGTLSAENYNINYTPATLTLLAQNTPQPPAITPDAIMPDTVKLAPVIQPVGPQPEYPFLDALMPVSNPLLTDKLNLYEIMKLSHYKNIFSAFPETTRNDLSSWWDGISKNR